MRDAPKNKEMHKFSGLISRHVPSFKSDAALVGVGALAGSLGSLVGLGGAFVIIPILTGPLGMSAHNAIGTSMAAVLATSAGSVHSYAAQIASADKSSYESSNTILNTGIPRTYGSIDVAAVLCIVSSAAICAPIGARLSKRVTDLYIRRAQSVLMMFAGTSLALREAIIDRYGASSGSGDKLSSESLAPAGQSGNRELKGQPKSLSYKEVVELGGIGVVSGLSAGFFGVGGGAIVVPALAIFMNFDQKTALGTSLAAMFPTAMSGAVVHYLQGTMLMRQALPLSAGCALGSMLGGKISAYIDDKYLKYLFSSTVFGLGLRAFLKSL